MPGVAASPSPSSKSQIPASKNKLKTVLGLGTHFKDPEASASPLPSRREHRYLARQSADTARNFRQRRKHRAERSSISDSSFFLVPPSDTIPSDRNAEPKKNMNSNSLKARPNRRHPLRLNAQDGPWSVSVAETPHRALSYNLYIKTPTHNLTLTRTAMEIVELHHKLCEAHPGNKIPPPPIDMSSLPLPPPKRKSTFLNTLSRLASPTSAKSGRHARNLTAVVHASDLTSSAAEVSDPFLDKPTTNGTKDAHTTGALTITGLAAYLTTISNTPVVRQARVWKRFVRVRTDDLESVRPERAIKRIRSDLASHVSPSLPPDLRPTAVAQHEEVVKDVRMEEHEGPMENGEPEPRRPEERTEQEIEEARNAAALLEDAAIAQAVMEDLSTSKPSPDGGLSKSTSNIDGVEPSDLTPLDTDVVAAADAVKDDTHVSTPVAVDLPAGRVHRSQSADPDKSSRLSRAYVSCPPNLDGASSQTGDESSISTTDNRRTRKKRSQSNDRSKPPRKSQRKVIIHDFEMMRVLGKGCAGKVLLVRHKSTSNLYALKAITKRHVLAHQELQHTLTEQAVLKRMAAESKDPFVVKLWWSFHDKENLFLVMDFHPGGDLATQLARWGRLGRDRARFYAAEIVEGVEGLHAAGVIYRDLKPENILIGADGHIVLTDFGLSKEFPRRREAITAPATPSASHGNDFYSSSTGLSQPATPPWMKGEQGELVPGWPGQIPGQGDSTSTFCGTAEYLAPEVIQGLPYGYEVDWWSFGTMLYEMLTGITPFWANNHSDMYVRVLQDELQFPDDRGIDQDTKSLIRGLLQRNPALRICEPRIKRHPYFSMIDWSHVYYKRYIPPYIPPIDPSNASDTQNFDDTFLDMEPVLDDANANEHTDTDQEREQTDTDRTDGEETNTTPSQSRSSSVHPQQRNVDDVSVDVFDGYSFKGRYSVLIDEEEEEESEEESDMELEELEGGDAEASNAELGVVQDEVDEELGEPKTPEARPSVLPELTEEVAEPTAVNEAPQPAIPDEVPAAPSADHESEVVVQESVPESSASALSEKDAKQKPLSSLNGRPAAHKSRPRREKSGVPALDRYLSDTIDEDTEATEREDEDDDWDIVEAADGEDRNGYKGTSLFARGVVDRYRLAVFRKASTPSQRSNPRANSGVSKDSDSTAMAKATESPTPSEKQRRGRNPGLTFRRSHKQFLSPKAPSKDHSPKSSPSGKTKGSVASNPGLLSPSPSMGSSLPVSPSLRSKESAVSMGGQSSSSDRSANGDAVIRGLPTQPEIINEVPAKRKTRKLKKYKQNAEKVFSLFASTTRQPL